ncbi:MAG: hypothetical protein U0228_38210 [Myxococcaceae bacterium]
MSQQAVVEQLKEKIRKLEAQPRQLVMALRTGWEALDAWGAFRLGGAVELCGEEASGRTTVALSVVAAACREKRLSAWVDGPQELYPPAALSMGVELARLLIVRPKTNQLVWSAMQLLRSGAFTCVVLDVTHTPARLSMVDTRKLLDAARTGGSVLVLLTPETSPAQGLPRLMLKTVPGGAGESSNVRVLHVERAPDLPITPTFELEAPHGRHTRVHRPHLHGKRAKKPWAPPPLVHIEGVASHQRPVKRNVLRDGYPFMAGSTRNIASTNNIHAAKASKSYSGTGGGAGWWRHPRESHRPVPAALSPPEDDDGDGR